MPDFDVSSCTVTTRRVEVVVMIVFEAVPEAAADADPLADAPPAAAALAPAPPALRPLNVRPCVVVAGAVVVRCAAGLEAFFFGAGAGVAGVVVVGVVVVGVVVVGVVVVGVVVVGVVVVGVVVSCAAWAAISTRPTGVADRSTAFTAWACSPEPGR